MAESLAALGVAANIVQFLELGFKVTKSIIETYRNIDTEGLAARHVDLSSITTSLKDRCTQLQSDAGVRADAITMELLRRCIKIANELLSQLESLTIAAGKRDPRWAKFVVSVKANWKKSAIEGLHSRMMDVKTEIFGRLEGLIQNTRVSMSTSEMMLSLGEASAAWNDATRRRLDAMAKELRDLLHSGSEVHSVQMLSFAGSLSRFADESKKQGAIRDILLSLKFTQIKERQNEILQAHKDTFEWMFDESSRVNFCSWLEKPSGGVFWITGKPGSGKSTLMKLILNHPKTLPLARKWSGSKPLVIARHFFWSVGSRLQRSQEGLLRTLLFQILVHSLTSFHAAFCSLLMG
ncbi:hypothetical protein CkaCkLH20_00596 [Colletotrichum karsti]|uniref:Nephrocystin 3-like N-terminal domain-containing protein n=1 Tax=Colletotrichum karsti TaxID=1095194 RepID=A0A9P6IEV6_9PEZI|nr:uncharacterized protein CkaCkLH20_00596 [Colletotrichum karsti]KAF9881450.1 hypothetical protein CkaCkLH20_00596 [Colletotrichum karsti]